jgi:pyrimidine-nucleoside phosphorylase
MLTASLLIKKRHGHELADDEIHFLVRGFCNGTVADYQMAALAMAICIQGMSNREVATLTQAMLQSGITLPIASDTPQDDSSQSKLSDRPRMARPRIDKHSTGGLGDKVSLILAPLVAEVGGDVPMISGRGLGITGGTLDKLEAIPGFQSDLSIERSSRVLQEAGAFIMGATDNLAPADRSLYALRDVTGTVESVPLITASILSKKLAANLDALVMDVKVGRAAFMKTLPDAEALAESLIKVGRQAGLPTSVIVSDMDQPLGSAVGNALEVIEAMDVLRGGGPDVVRELTLELATNLLLSVNLASTRDAAMDRLNSAIDSGRAMERFERMVHAQNGDLTQDLQIASATEVLSEETGFLEEVDCQKIGQEVISMGGGRQKVGDTIDHRVGVMIHARIGEPIQKGQPIFTVHCDSDQTDKHVRALRGAYKVSGSAVAKRRLVMRRFGPT